jgi:hypothetical protein
MDILISLVTLAAALGSLGCFIFVLIKMFSAEGLGTGLLGLICALYALYWAYKNREQQKLQNVVAIWAILIAINILLGFVVQGAGS